MKGALLIRRGLTWTLSALAALIVVASGLIVAVDAGYCRGLLIDFFSARLGRPIQVHGAVKAHIFSLNPQLTAEDITIGNPPWVPTGLTAQAGKISVVLRLPEFGRSAGI